METAGHLLDAEELFHTTQKLVTGK